MRVVVAPDSFGETLTAPEAAKAIAAGWVAAAPGDELDLAPLSDGGPGFLDVLAASLGGDRIEVVVGDPLGRPVHADLLVDGDTVYIESAQACGLQLVAPNERDPLRASTAGLGDLLRAAATVGPKRVVVGLGGSATNDGGAGMLERLGFDLRDDTGGPLHASPRALAELSRASCPDGWWRSVDLVAATDVDNPLLGPSGATAVFGPQKGAGQDAIGELERALAHLAEVVGRDVPGAAGLEQRPGAGAAGGAGYGLLVLGGRIEPGIEIVLRRIGFGSRVRRADVVVTGEGSFDEQSLRGKVVSGVSGAAAAAGARCLVLAGQVMLSEAEYVAAGITAAYSISAEAGSVEASLREPGRFLEQLARRVATAVSG
jgi:glycerate kinase